MYFTFCFLFLIIFITIVTSFLVAVVIKIIKIVNIQVNFTMKNNKVLAIIRMAKKLHITYCVQGGTFVASVNCFTTKEH